MSPDATTRVLPSFLNGTKELVMRNYEVWTAVVLSAWSIKSDTSIDLLQLLFSSLMT